MPSTRAVCSSLALMAVACSATPASSVGGAGDPAPPIAQGAAGSPAAADPWLTPAATAALPAVAGPDARRWIPGDLHMHVGPFDGREGASLGVADLAGVGRAAGLEFVIATPHLRPSTLEDPARRRAWMADWREMAAAARAQRGFTVIPGIEWTVWEHGHYGVSGVDFTTLRDDDDVLGFAHRAGGFVVVNHAFATPTAIPGIPITERDLSYRPWTSPARGGVDEDPMLDGVEVWNVPLALANLVSRPGGLTGEQRAFTAADRLARAQGHPVATVGGSDSHGSRMVVTTWVLAAEATEQAILAALRSGATCVGGVDAGALVAHGDGDPADRWARIGEVVRATEVVELRWTGRARLFVDGLDQGEHDGAYVHRGGAGRHTYRIELNGSRCGFVYANLAS